jgi:hypothetical protein
VAIEEPGRGALDPLPGAPPSGPAGPDRLRCDVVHALIVHRTVYFWRKFY